MLSRAPLIIFFAIAPLTATVIVQKNGDVISGKIIEEKADKYVFQSPYGKLQIAKGNVAKLILDESTLELKNVAVDGKTVKARLVNQENSTAVYLTEDGRTIRKEEKSEAPVAPINASATVDRLLLGIHLGYGFANFPQASESNQQGGQFDQSLRLNALQAQISLHYAFWRFLGAGLVTTYGRWSGPVSQRIQPPAQTGFDVDTATSHAFLSGAAGLVTSLFGKLGVQNTSHDIRIVVSGGMAFGSSDMQLSFRNPPQAFPNTASAASTYRSFVIGSSIEYLYGVSESLRFKLGLSYYRIFNSNVFSGTTLASSPPVLGQFATDFNANLARNGQAPQIMALELGVEIGF